METLFTTDLVINGKTESFAVSFHNDQYQFKSLSSNSSFSIQREDDEWHADEKVEDSLKSAATEKLDAYLLSQH